jgi:hypothetical protein
LIASLLLSVACTHIDEIPGENGLSGGAISFRTQSDASALLRATVTTPEYLNSFVVNAVPKDINLSDDYILNGVTVYRRNSNEDWQYAPEAYFPPDDAADGYVDFYAYSPAGAQKLSSLKDNTTQTLTYEVPVPDPTDLNGNTTQQDLLVAYERIPKAEYTSSVVLQFRHALSRIHVKALNKILPGVEVTIDSLKLKSLIYKGKLSLAGNTATAPDISNGIPQTGDVWQYKVGAITSASDYVTRWQPVNDADNKRDFPYVLPESGVKVPYGTDDNTQAQKVTSYEQGMFVMPQTTPGDFCLEVWYRANNLTDKATLSFHDPILGGGGTQPYTFEIGRQYTLLLTFSLTPVTAA